MLQGQIVADGSWEEFRAALSNGGELDAKAGVSSSARYGFRGRVQKSREKRGDT